MSTSLAASSSVTLAHSSPTGPPKRATPHDVEPAKSRPKPKQKVAGPFIVEDDESDDEFQSQDATHISKKRMLEHPFDTGAVPTVNEETGTNDNELEPPNIQSERLWALPELENLPSWKSGQSLFSRSIAESIAPLSYTATTCSGKSATVQQRKASVVASYESIVAARSRTKEGRAKRSYYGIDIHELINDAATEAANKRQTTDPRDANRPIVSVEAQIPGKKPKKTLLWTEKYRARKFVDLCGDDGTNRHVLRWLKRWDPVVFPGQARSKHKTARRPGMNQQVEEEKPHRKILMLTGPPGLGKTTLAHVCARQAGYEVLEVNASDDRSRDVVNNRIRTSLGTESVKNVVNNRNSDGSQKMAKPVCVVVDEVDGAVSGSGGSGEGGFVRAMIDLVLADQKNSAGAGASGSTYDGNRKKKKKKAGDDFRLLRPLILICNDVYHPSLRPLRQSNLAEIIHVGKPSLETVVSRITTVFEKEGIPCDKDAARKLCEAAWGMTSGIDARRGAESTVEGDLRGVMVVGEWVAGRFRASPEAANQRLSRQWIDVNILGDLASGAAGARGLGRGNIRDIVQRLFLEGGGFPKQAMKLHAADKTQHEQPQAELGFGEQQKKYAMERLRQMIDSSGEISTIMTQVFAEYPDRDFNDDIYLTKPNLAYDWLHFHDACQSRLYTSQDWELAPYLSQPILACHHLFASPKRHYGGGTGGFERRWDGAGHGAQRGAAEDDSPPVPFSGPRADYQAREAEKQTRSQLQALQAQLSPTLTRSFRSPEDIATELLPYLMRLVSPDVKPVVIGGSQGSTASVRKESEKIMVKRASEVLADLGIQLQRGKVESEGVGAGRPQYVYRLEPDLDSLCTFETSTLPPSLTPTRYAVRQVLDQELARTKALRANAARQARFQAGATPGDIQVAPQPFTYSAPDHEKHRSLLAQQPFQKYKLARDAATIVKKDFFGRIIEARPLAEFDPITGEKNVQKEENKVWVTYHEGLNNAVTKPISYKDFMSVL
ncbi:hypothetical protein E4U45_003316 [Claviceps purpurea]|nr:hypothetical protein E4U45_003316 [Claviceps purpurea]